MGEKGRAGGTPRSAGEECRKVRLREGWGLEKESKGDRNGQVELFYRYVPCEGRQKRVSVTGRIIETHGQ